MLRIGLLLLLTALLLLSPACQAPAPSVTDPQTTSAPDVPPTPMDDGTIAIAAGTPLLSGVGENPFDAASYINPDAPETRNIKLELTTYPVYYQDSGVGQGMDGDLDRYVGGKNGDVSVWYKAGSDEIVSLELTTPRDYTNDGEAFLVVKAANLLEHICDFDLETMERSYSYIPKVQAQHERLVTVKYEIPREDGRCYRDVVVDFHSNMISIVITNLPEPPAKEMETLLGASEQLDEYLIYTRDEQNPIVTEVSSDALPEVYYKDGRWVLETKRTVTYLIGKNEMTASIVFYLWAI